VPQEGIWGWDNPVWRKVLVDALGRLQIDIAAMSMPAGLATEATLATLATEAKLETVRVLLASIDGKDFATQVTLAALLTELQLKADLTETQPVSAAALPLPAGAATAAHQVTIQGYIDAIETLLNAGLPSVLDTDALKVREQNWPAEYPLSAAQIALLQAVTVGNFPATYPLSAAQIASLRSESFGGNVYSKTMTMTDDNATRFEAATKKLRDVVIIVSDNEMLLGETGAEVYPVGVSETIGFTRVDISTLYFKNAGAGDNGTITILGVEE